MCSLIYRFGYTCACLVYSSVYTLYKADFLSFDYNLALRPMASAERYPDS